MFKGGKTYATWFSEADFNALGEIWGFAEGSSNGTTTPSTDRTKNPYQIDVLINGGINLPDFDPIAGDHKHTKNKSKSIKKEKKSIKNKNKRKHTTNKILWNLKTQKKTKKKKNQ
jgi:hypothetical protein